MGMRNQIRLFAAAAAVMVGTVAAPARAERLVFDHRLYPPLKASLDSGDPARIAFNGKNPRYVIDLIVVKGTSAENWTEALEIIARSPEKNVRTAREWAGEVQARTVRGCQVQLVPVAEDETSLTFEQHADACPRARAETSITRVVQGKRSLFLLTVLVKGIPDDAARRQWLALLQSAHIE